METQLRAVDYFSCPRVLIKWALLDASKHLISFASGYDKPQSLAQWEEHTSLH